MGKRKNLQFEISKVAAKAGRQPPVKWAKVTVAEKGEQGEQNVDAELSKLIEEKRQRKEFHLHKLLKKAVTAARKNAENNAKRKLKKLTDSERERGLEKNVTKKISILHDADADWLVSLTLGKVDKKTVDPDDMKALQSVLSASAVVKLLKEIKESRVTVDDVAPVVDTEQNPKQDGNPRKQKDNKPKSNQKPTKTNNNKTKDKKTKDKKTSSAEAMTTKQPDLVDDDFFVGNNDAGEMSSGEDDGDDTVLRNVSRDMEELQKLGLIDGWDGGQKSKKRKADPGKKKNRMGQQARRKLAEQMFGEETKLKPRPPKVKEPVRNKRRDPRSGTSSNGPNRGSNKGARGGGPGKSEPDAADLHPSWEATRLRKQKEEEMQKAKFAGKRKTFD